MAFDPDYANVALLLHMDGANGSTTFTDNSPTPKTVTVSGTVNLSTAQSKFGGASALFSGQGVLLVGHSEALSIGSGDFTIEFMLRMSAPGMLLNKQDGSSGACPPQVVITAEGAIKFRSYGASFENFFNTTTPGGVISTGGWHHIALERVGSTFSVYVDGVLKAAGTYSGALPVNTAPLSIGGYSNLSGDLFSGNIDEFRITKGLARYAANFAPPTAPFPDSAPAPALSAYAAAPTPLGDPTTLAASIRQAWGSAASPLGTPAVLAASGENFFARAAAATPLGAPLALARAVGAARVATAGPLGAGAALGQLVAVARAMAVGPLGAPVVMASTPKVQAVLYATGHLGTSHGTTAAELGYDAVLRPPGTRGTRYGFQAIVYTPVTLTMTVRQESSSGAVTRHGTPIATGATSLQATGAAPSTQHGTPNAMAVLRAAGHLAANHGTPGAGNVLRPAGRCGTNHGAVRITSTLHAVGHLATRRGTPTSTASTILMAHGHTDTQYGTPRVGTLTLRACFTAPGVRHGRPRIDRGATC